MRILVTGGAGFIGSNMVHHLLGDEPRVLGVEIERVVNLDKLTYAGNRAHLECVKNDSRHVFVHGAIEDEALVTSLFNEHQVDAVIHLAAESHVDRSIGNPEEFIMTNIVGTYRLLECFRTYLAEGKRVGKSFGAKARSVFLHVSTDEVFGSLGAGEPAFCESSPYAPNSPYSASKAGSDHLVRAYHQTYGLPVITTHCSNNFGPYQFPEKLLPLMIRKTLQGEPLPVYGDGKHVRDWLYVEDHCRGLMAALVRGSLGANYLIGGRCEMSNIDVVRRIIKTVRELAPDRSIKSADELIHYVTDRPGHDRRYAINPSRITEELGWAPQETFDSGLRKTVQWCLENEEWLSSRVS